jgi:RNA polymerase sigma-70 factor, ECF subfamily
MKVSASDFRTTGSGRPHAYPWGVRRHSAPRQTRSPANGESVREQPDSQRPNQDGRSGMLYTEARREQLFDQAYLIALRDQDQGAEANLVTFFARPLWLKLHARLRAPQLIEDARQETFLRIFTYFRSGKTLDNPASLPGFVLSVCNNVCFEVLRSHTRHPQMPQEKPDPPDAGMNPEQSVVTEERKQIVTRILHDLGPRDRELLQRVFLEEADKDEVCADLGVTRQYLRVLVHRAKVRLKTALAGTGVGGGQ